MDVVEWLRKLGLEEYAPAFRANHIDGEVLRRLTAEDLRDLGVTSIGHRRRLLDAIRRARRIGGQTAGGRVGHNRIGGAGQVPACRACCSRAGRRGDRRDAQRAVGRLPRSIARPAADQIWGTRRSVSGRGLDHSGRNHSGFRAEEVIASVLVDRHLVLWVRIVCLWRDHSAAWVTPFGGAAP